MIYYYYSSPAGGMLFGVGGVLLLLLLLIIVIIIVILTHAASLKATIWPQCSQSFALFPAFAGPSPPSFLICLVVVSTHFTSFAHRYHTRVRPYARAFCRAFLPRLFLPLYLSSFFSAQGPLTHSVSMFRVTGRHTAMHAVGTLGIRVQRVGGTLGPGF